MVVFHTVVRRLLSVLGVLGVAVALFVPTAPGASADQQDYPNISPTAAASYAPETTLETQAPSCPLGTMCVWVNINYGGSRGWFEFDNRDWRNFSQSSCSTGTWHDCASSFWNNGRQCNVATFEFTNFGGFAIVWPRGTGSSDLRQNNMNDRISSNQWCV